MTGDEMPRRNLAEPGALAMADVPRNRAARLERAADGDVERARDFARQHADVLVLFHIRREYGAQQRLRVGMGTPAGARRLRCAP